MEEKMTMEITNDKLEEAIKIYAAERTKENLSTVLNLLRPTKLLIPAMLKAPDQPTPCFLKRTALRRWPVTVWDSFCSRVRMYSKLLEISPVASRAVCGCAC